MATVPREEMIISKDYAKSCDYSWSEGLTEPLPSGIINIPIEHFYEFMETCGDSDNEYIIVSQRSDLGLAYQREFPVSADMEKWVKSLPYMDGLMDLTNLGYRSLEIPPRCDVTKCEITDNYSIKCDSYTWSTIPNIPSNVKKWYMTNCMTEEPGHLICIPFGILDDEAADKLVQTPQLDKKNWLYANFQTYTLERFYLKSQLGAKSMSQDWITFVSEAKPIEEYFRDISEHRYVMCPDGNGIDCFRTWETLYLGSIPIVKRSRVTEQFSDLPMLIVDDLFSVTLEMLEEKYEEILLKKDNLDKAKLSYWTKIFKESKDENCN